MSAQVDIAATQQAHNTIALAKRIWPEGVVQCARPRELAAIEEAMLLDGISTEWQTSAGAGDLAYLRKAVDRYVTPDGEILNTPMTEKLRHNDPKADDLLGPVALGRAVLLVYRTTGDARYYKAATSLREHLPSLESAHWRQHGQEQRRFELAYMEGPFLAAYGSTFQEPQILGRVANQLLLMGADMGGLPLKVDAWYAMTLVDVLDWFPAEQPQRPALIAALKQTMKVVGFSGGAQSLHRKNGLWNSTLNGRHEYAERGSEASSDCILIYALAKGVRMGYLPQTEEHDAQEGWRSIQTEFREAQENIPVSARNEDIDHVGVNTRSSCRNLDMTDETLLSNAENMGSYLKVEAEMEQAATEALGQDKVALLDAWFNSQTRKNAAGQTELYHYKWDDERDSGFTFAGRAFQRYGVSLREERHAPTKEDLAKVQIYLIVSPDTLAKNPDPHQIDKASGDVIENWVKAGGVLLLFSNDRDNTEFVGFNSLSDRFGMHFNPVLSHHVVEPDHGPGEVTIPSGTGVFGSGFQAYMKDTSTITVRGRAKVLVRDRGDVMIAIAPFGKGAVLGVVDPWIYNEYVSGLKMSEYQGFRAAVDLAGWAVRSSK